MIFIKLSKTGSIEFIHHDPLNTNYGLGTEEELKELEANGEGVLLEQLPESQVTPGKQAVLKYDKEKGLYHEYVDAPITPEKELENTKKQMALMQQALDEMIINNPSKEVQALNDKQVLMQKALDELIISSIQ
ncbi:hypothetical protein N7X28_28545 [Bacillus sp. SM-B1]|uniref:hypothetical protein n=1 Tax=Bacillus sp. SM-B1 TaxID=2980102 RepID=UPI002949D2A3|nr:hypothetical protein [Bacillus sp. SM-B1]MDV6040370.1 hypothetical protein [Bacillus sp. SM-B1]